MNSQNKNSPKVCLVANGGGHFQQLVQISRHFEDVDKFWVTIRGPDTVNFLEEENVYWGHGPTVRNIKNFFRNLILAWNILRKEKPQVILSTGAGLAPPFLMLASVMNIKSMFIESFSRVKDISLSGYLVRYFVDQFYVQWPELAEKYPWTTYTGSVLEK